MTLTEASYYTRKFAPFAVFAFVVLLIFFYSIKLFLLVVSLNQPKVTYVNPLFKEIKPPTIKKDATTSAGFSFVLDTIDGAPVSATETAEVFLLPKAKFQFDYLPKVYVMAKTLGFDTEVIKHKLVNNEAVFDDGIRHLAIDITTYNFRYDYDFKKDTELVDNLKTPDKSEAENSAINFLKSIDRYPNEFTKGKTNPIYMLYDKVSSNAAVIDNLQQANMIEIDFYRPDIGQYPVVSSSYYNSQNYVVMMSTPETTRIVSAQMKFFEKSSTQIGVYPLITGQAAYDALLGGKATIVSTGTGKKDITIKKMFLGYFDPDIYQDYLWI